MPGVKQLSSSGPKKPAKRETVPKVIYKQDEWLIDQLEIGLERKQRPPRAGVFYPSALGNLCDRYLYYSYNGLLVGETIPGKLRRIFDNGDYLGNRYEAYFTKLGILVSTEQPLKLDTPSISGRIDFVILHPDAGHLVIELKSINDRGFKALKYAPKPEHLIQIQLYLNIGCYENGVLLYENKNTQEVKAFQVAKSAEIMTDILNRCLAIMAMTKAPEECTGESYCQCKKVGG
jgi:hypothetical protein|tara:strand:+ start:1560 stop:2258 length:699 start_codon:yes stop_codon:yes gene_type:complete